MLLRQEVEAALAAGVVVVASAGNYPHSQKVPYPAAIEGVVAVAGVGKDGKRSDISVSGPEVVIAAPSDDISSTGLGGRYTVSSGTSDATAIVAGAVALVRSRFPDLKGPEVVRRLTATAIDKGAPGRDPEYGYGVLNLVGALTADLPAATAPASGKGEPSRESPIAGPADASRFPWWLVAGLPVVVLGVAWFWWVRRRRAVS